MTSEEICNGNALIAHFMGLKRGDDWQVRNRDANWCHPMDLKYNTDWNWLMPVCERCSGGINNGTQLEVKYSYIQDAILKHDIKKTFELIVGYISMRYEITNTQKPKPIEFYEG